MSCIGGAFADFGGGGCPIFGIRLNVLEFDACHHEGNA